MNIEIANHLVQLRKQNGYSQEALAEKLGLSRQAVSKWERAEASPDTDNLIALAKLYHMTLDELLLMKDGETAEAGAAAQEQEPEEEAAPEEKAAEEKQAHSVHVGFKGVHVVDGGNEVHVSHHGVFIQEDGKEKVRVDKEGVYVDGEEQPQSRWMKFPFPILVAIVYLVFGFTLGCWHPGWLIFLTIPLYYSLVDAILKRAPHHFAWPVLAALVYLCLGLFGGFWAWGWIVFLTIPIYYCIFPGVHEKEEDGQ